MDPETTANVTALQPAILAPTLCVFAGALIALALGRIVRGPAGALSLRLWATLTLGAAAYLEFVAPFGPESDQVLLHDPFSRFFKL
ncbi:MAG TPA: hypothetical protein VLB27_01500, partial [candidate division Zixibacteria bacterium]|nr:hypothetical protein [candidate division Zixibacteria bacterium]